MVTLALVLINLLLTAILAVAILPEVKNVNSLVSKVASAIDLDQNGSATASNGEGNSDQKVSIADQTMIAIGGDDGLTINLKSTDGKNHVAVIKAQLIMNSKAKSYKVNYAALTNESGSAAGQVSQAIQQTVSQYTVTQMQNNQQTVIDACTKAEQKLFDKDFVVGVSFTNVIYQ